VNISALIIDVTLWGSVLILGFMAWQRGRVVLVSSVREGSMDFINIVPRIALGVIGSGYIAAVIPPEVITGWLGPDSGWLGVLTAVIAGAATPGGPVVGFSIGAVALKVGGGPPQVVAYVVAWALFAFQRMILWEIPFMPARFVWFRAAVSVPFPFLAAAIAMVIGNREARPRGLPAGGTLAASRLEPPPWCLRTSSGNCGRGTRAVSSPLIVYESHSRGICCSVRFVGR